MLKPDDNQHEQSLLMQVIQDFRQRLAHEGVTPEIDPHLPAREQLIRLQEAVVSALSQCRQQAASSHGTEEALNESEARFRTMADALPQLAWIAHADGYIYWYNQRWYEYTGTTPAQMEGWGWQSVHDPETLPKVLEQWTASIATGQPFDMVFPLRGADGRFRPFLTRVMPLKDAEGRVVEWFGTNTDITELQEAQASLRYRVEQFEALFNQAPLGVYLVDADFRMVQVNPVAMRAFEGIPGGVIGRDFEEVHRIVWPSPFVDEVIRIFRHTLETGEPYHQSELAQVRADRGVTEYYEWRIERITLPDGRYGVVCYFSDISAQVKAREVIAESEARFSAMANNISQLAWMADETGWIFWYNKRWYEYTGTTPEQMEGWGWQRVHDPTVLPKVLEEWQRSIATGEPFDMEFPLRGADGRFRPFLTRIFPVKDAENRVVYWFGTNTDISEIRKAQDELHELNRTLEQRVQERTEELRAAGARFEGLLESAPDSIVIVDAEGTITLVNTQLEHLTGFTRDELLGKPVEVLVPDRYGLIHVQHRADFLAAPRTRPMGVGLDLYIQRKDGSEVPVEISLSPFTSSEGTLVIASIRDITARKEAEAEITRLNTALQSNVEQLTTANKELEAFSYSVSHDLRAPLRSIDGFTKVLTEQYLDLFDERGRDYLTRVRTAAQRMNRLIDDMLNLSRIGRAEMRRDTVNLSYLATSVLTDLHERDPERQVDVEIQPDLLVNGDAGLLRIVLENLMGNAWKFTSKMEHARIEVGMMMQDDARVYYVRDNGAGFDMAYADKLFTPFQRLHTEDEFPGTGIGLAIVQRIISRHGGQVWAESEEGKGATFYFTLGGEQ